MPANPATLFVGDLSVHCTERELCQLFCKFGPVENVQIKRESGRAEHLSYGFVKFGSRSCAEKALELNGTVIYGRRLR
jgi:RNA recognition motif-containing protein